MNAVDIDDRAEFFIPVFRWDPVDLFTEFAVCNSPGDTGSELIKTDI